MNWLTSTTPTALLLVIASTLLIYTILIIYTRLAGLRSFSKMSSFDFAITVAFGSVLASTVITPDPPVLQAAVALGSLYAVQYAVSFLRTRFSFISKLVDNKPLLLMAGETILEENLAEARVSKAELRNKLREANVTAYSQIKAVILESTGDVAVLHSESDEPLEDFLVSDVRDAEKLQTK